MLDWLLAPIDPVRMHEVGDLMSWHGRLMVLAWGVFVPVGILIARFFKITPKQDWPAQLDNRFWWFCHLLLQNTGFMLMLVALALVWYAPRYPDQAGNHYLYGWSVFLLGLVQIAGGYLRGSKGGPTSPAPDGSLRGDHYDMTPRRILFERIHKSLGYVALAFAVAAVLSGMWQANAPRWFLIGISAWWLLLLTAFVLLQRRGKAVDTYQAIWGPDRRHPGNVRAKPIGLGIRRRHVSEREPGE